MVEPRFEVIDSDGHVIEPDAVWSEYADPEFRDILATAGGGYVQSTGVKRAYPDMPASFLDGQGGADADPAWEEVAENADWDEESKYKMSRPGGHDPVARLVDMDAEGIDVAVLYPTAMLTWIEEADIFGAACRAYNNWLYDYCSAAPDRLFPVALVPLQDPEAAVVEMRRAVAQLGAKAVMIRPAPYIGERKLNDPAYDPFWAAAAQLDCPIGVHPSPHGDMPNSCRLLGLADGVTNPTEGLALRQGLTNAFDLQMAVAYFVLGGICERHPRLRVAFLEGTGGWIVPMLQRFDHQFEITSSDRRSRRVRFRSGGPCPPGEPGDAIRNGATRESNECTEDERRYSEFEDRKPSGARVDVKAHHEPHDTSDDARRNRADRDPPRDQRPCADPRLRHRSGWYACSQRRRSPPFATNSTASALGATASHPSTIASRNTRFPTTFSWMSTAG